MSKIRELQPAHKSEKVTVGEAARAFKNVKNAAAKRQTASSISSDKRYVRREENGRFTSDTLESAKQTGKKGQAKGSRTQAR